MEMCRQISAVLLKKTLMWCLMAGLVMGLACGAPVCAKTPPTDTIMVGAIKAQLVKYRHNLYYPQSVTRFYQQNGYSLAWLAPITQKTHAWEALMMLDCVSQFGLRRDDYYPDLLLFEQLNTITSHMNMVSAARKAVFDMLITDAMINFINNLHFGRLNPVYFARVVDADDFNGLQADSVLARALKSDNFMMEIASVQPHSKQYTYLQNRLRLITGQYVGDCYETPDSVARLIGINMERLRWNDIDDKVLVNINIPSFSLSLKLADTVYHFKVVVGKPQTPSPTLSSKITHFQTAPEWNVPQKIFVKELLPRALRNSSFMEQNRYDIYDRKGNYLEPTRNNLLRVKQNPSNYYIKQSSGCDNALGLVVFRFANIYDIYLHDTPDQKLFKKETRAYSHGCIRVEQAERLAGLLLSNDGSAVKLADLHKAFIGISPKTFMLTTPVPIKITYLTCEVKKGLLVLYPDVYGLDAGLGLALFDSATKYTMQ